MRASISFIAASLFLFTACVRSDAQGEPAPPAPAAPPPSAAATAPQAPKAAQGAYDILFGAYRDDDWPVFQLGLSDTAQANISRDSFEAIVAAEAPHLRAGYTSTYVTDLVKKSATIYMWKLTFQDDSDEVMLVLGIAPDQTKPSTFLVY